MEKFSKWVKPYVDKLPAEVIAVNFNLYETSDDIFEAQIVGCTEYDSENQDWACDTVFSSEEDLYRFKASDWEEALEKFLDMAKAAISEHDLMPDRIEYITAGFVDGDLEVIRPAN